MNTLITHSQPSLSQPSLSQPDNPLILECPHCQGIVEISQSDINCGIFRHGVFKMNNTQINPHLPKHICDHLVENNLIYGCGRPFLIKKINDNWVLEICDYI